LVRLLPQNGSRRTSSEWTKPAKRFWALKPVAFHYKSDSKATPQFGLIAEEVATVDPNLVVRAKNGEIYTEATNGD